MTIFNTDFAQLWTGAQQFAWAWLPRFVGVVIVLFLLRFAVRWAERAARRILEPSKLGPGLTALLVRAMRIAVLLLGLLSILFILDLNDIALSFITGLGITGLLLAFALQEIAKNVAAGFLLLFQRPFNVGDRIRLGDQEGTVHDIGLRATHLRTDDGREVMLPNAGVYTGIITNLTRYPSRRFSQTLKLNAGAPLAEVLLALEAAARRVDGIHDQPPPEALIVDAAGPTVEVRYWVTTIDGDPARINSRVAHQLRDLVAEKGWL